mmetsp:Transcript_320/g.771  ORF Transcript_320/g.771 Transcript_320/m.771 type:complete len:654 (-) Transcript_320:84-2045(-)
MESFIEEGTTSFDNDTPADCAICLEPLSSDGSGGGDAANNNSNNHDNDNDDNVIRLSCGHVYHFECVLQQIQTAQPQPGRRLLFRGCQCALCGTVCDDHPRLSSSPPRRERDNGQRRSTDRLRKEVDELLIEQLKEEQSDVFRMAHEQGDAAMASLLEEGRRRYAFYLCGHCDKPYFGGTVDCAEDMMVRVEEDHNNNQQTSPLSADEKLCPSCAPQTQIVCHNPLEHGRYLVWKCRYCCQPATHLCYGSVHFCQCCHERNSTRVAEFSSSGSRILGVRPPPLQPVPCPGVDQCGFPKPHPTNGGTDGDSDDDCRHKNGSIIECEQVYYCVLCDSAGRRHYWSSHHDDFNIRPGSPNLVRNPSGAEGLEGWQQTPRAGVASMWKVEQSELPLNEGTTTNFVSSFQPCIMSQVIDLDEILNVEVPTSVQIEFASRYTGRSDCPSIFAMQAVVLADQNDSQPNRQPVILHRQSTPTLQSPPGDYWERTVLDLDIQYRNPDTNIESTQLRPRFLKIFVMGKDTRFWQGRFGSKVADVSVRIIGSPENLESILSSRASNRALPGVEDETIDNGRGTTTQHQPELRRRARHQQNDAPRTHTNNSVGSDRSQRVPDANAHTTTVDVDGPHQRNYSSQRLVLEVFIPAVCFVAFLWLTQQ